MKAVNKLHNGVLINFLLIVFQAGLFLSVFGLFFNVLLGVLELYTGDSTSPMDFPVMFSMNHAGVINLIDHPGVVNFGMESGIGTIAAENLPKGFVSLYGIIYILGLSCFLLILKLTIDILKAVKKGGFLIIENAIRLRKIALLGIVMYFFESLATFVASNYLSDKLQFEGLEFTSFNSYLFFDIQTVIYSLFLLVISEAFRMGALLKQEVDLTI